MTKKELETVSIIGLGLLGGSLGLAVNRALPKVKRLGYSHRAVTRRKALDAGVIDVSCKSLAEAVSQAQLVVLASPISTFAQLMQEMAEFLNDNCLVTDVGSTKVLPTRLAQRYLKGRVQFLGSHPMAGSEQRGVAFAQADLFDDAYCIITPTARTSKQTIKVLSGFWRRLGMRVGLMSPVAHDRILARISHLPHVLAAALINCSNLDQMALCGKGFLDTTRIASGPPEVWRDILMSNAANTDASIDKLIKELRLMQKALRGNNEKKITALLRRAQSKRNCLVQKRHSCKRLPSA